MNRIILLDDTTISKIAAGEVIERPSSAVKELVENSIDAGATSILIEVKEGGKKLIRITDNGSGMNADEAKMAVQRHATSKIKSADDLFSITTLGFRGEALASIASVSKFELITNADSNDAGTKIRIEGGQLKKTESVSHKSGTTISAEDLFYNTPARLKFQKTKFTELSHIIDAVSRFILSHPKISFKLVSDGEESISSLGSRKLMDAIASVYGTDMARTMLEVGSAKAEGGSITVHGYVSQPVITKSDRNAETVIINGRFVRNMLVSRALEDAYRALIPHGKYPVAVVFINMPTADVDVNVHPAKREVKFARADEIMKAVSGAVSKALSGISASTSAPAYSGNWRVEPNAWGQEGIQIQERLTQAFGQPSPQSGEGSSSLGEERGEAFQYLLTYIICVDGEDLLMIDQHAAHERIMYEKFKNKQDVGVQNLLVPETIELEAKDFALISEHINELKELGFEVEVFGKNTLMIRGVPSLLMAKNIDAALKETISELSQSFKIKSVDERKDSLYKMMACKAAVKAGDKLSYAEMTELVRQLKATSNPTTCPHGRPTIVKFNKAQMEKMFGRA